MTLQKLISNLAQDYPNLKFQIDSDFFYSPSTKSIHYNPDALNSTWLLLHEIGHYILNHRDYLYDLELIRMEVDAWEIAKTKLATKYGIEIDPSWVDNILDSYRNWLHARSQCPNCDSIGYQKSITTYKCIECGTIWSVNSAKKNRLKRITLDI